MNIIKLALISAFLIFSNISYAQISKNGYTPDHINFLTPAENFQDLDISPKEMGKWINSVDNIFNQVFAKDIAEKNENKVVMVLATIKAIDKSGDACKKDYTECVMMGIEIKYTENIPQEQIEKFSNQLNQVKEIKIGNTKSLKEGVFISYLNTRKDLK